MSKSYITISPFSRKETFNFWKKVKIGSPDECWQWQASRNKKGYGHFGHREKIYAAHRIAYFLHYKKDPCPFLVCHTCDNPGCCNPRHLFLGTDMDNRIDAVQKGRIAKGPKLTAALLPHLRLVWKKGQEHPMAKLTDADVLEIRAKYERRVYTHEMLAAEYGVSFGMIGHIICRRSWKHI